MILIHNITNTIFTSKTYILYKKGFDSACLVDIGDIEPVLGFLDAHGLIVNRVLLTHAHFDHIYGLPHLTELFPDVRVYTNNAGRDALGNSRLNMSKYLDNPITYESEKIEICKEGTEIELFRGISAKVYETPGHHPSCLTFMVGDYLFTGDAFIPDVAVVTVLPGANKQQAAASEKRILSLAEGKIVCSGHEITHEIMSTKIKRNKKICYISSHHW